MRICSSNGGQDKSADVNTILTSTNHRRLAGKAKIQCKAYGARFTLPVGHRTHKCVAKKDCDLPPSRSSYYAILSLRGTHKGSCPSIPNKLCHTARKDCSLAGGTL